MKRKICPNCKEEFEGRRNKKFCTVSCKNQFHNEEYRESNSAVFEVNKMLTKNRAILRNLFKIYRSSAIQAQILEAHGFNFKFHTHQFNSPAGGTYTMIYEMGYKKTFDDQVLIVELDEVS